MAGVFYKHKEWKPVTDSPHKEEEGVRLHSVCEAAVRSSWVLNITMGLRSS